MVTKIILTILVVLPILLVIGDNICDSENEKVELIGGLLVCVSALILALVVISLITGIIIAIWTM